MKLSTELLHETAHFVKEYYEASFSPAYSFHNYNRTLNIVKNCGRLGEQMKVDKDDLKYLLTAAWLLETGYCKDYTHYQAASLQIANEYLITKNIDEDTRNIIGEIILATRTPQQPITLLGQVICDASMYHLAEKNFLHNMENLRQERSAIAGIGYTDAEWQAEITTTITDHFYFTAAARELFSKKKKKQKSLLHPPVEIQKTDEEEPYLPDTTTNSGQSLEPYLENIKLERGVETFFRTTARRHMELSAMAHDKASLLISINAIVVSIVLSVLITKLDENKYLLLPTLLLVITCVSTIVLSVISTRPRYIKKDKHDKNSQEPESNILFFGDFAKLSLSDYKRKMKETYKNKNELYDSLSRDIYYQGIILVWKYKFINIAYTVFMYGFIITILSFIIAFAVHPT